MTAGAASDVAQVLGLLRLAIAKRAEPALADRLPIRLGHRVSALRVERGREALGLDAPSVHVAAAARTCRCSRARPSSVRARAYDLALNGSEIAGGSIRIHRADVQRHVFRLLGISDEDAKARFGFFLDALEYGTPPHGGIAFGLDRIVALLCGEAVDSRGDRVPEDRAGDGPDGRRAVARSTTAAPRTAHSDQE